MGKPSANKGAPRLAQIWAVAPEGHAHNDCIESPIRIEFVILTHIPLGKVCGSKVKGKRPVVRTILSSPNCQTSAPTAGKMRRESKKRQLPSQLGICRRVVESVIQGCSDCCHCACSDVKTDRMIVHWQDDSLSLATPAVHSLQSPPRVSSPPPPTAGLRRPADLINSIADV